MLNNLIDQDASQRQLALDPHQSFIVQAPAGSGKTELLTQRFLVLLGQVNSPEEILAITFTKKAAAEMRSRIIKTLKKASLEPEPILPHEKKTWHLANMALKRNDAFRWQLLENPNRLRIQTMDSFSASLIKHLPILSHFGAPPDIVDDPNALYQEAVQEFLSHLEENVAWSDAIATLLTHQDNNLEKVQELLIKMLAKRDQWLHYLIVDMDPTILRAELESHLSNVVEDILITLENNFPSEYVEEIFELAEFSASNLEAPISFDEAPTKEHWLFISNLLLTKELCWRKCVDKRIGFPAPTSTKVPEEKILFKDMKQRIENLVSVLSSCDNLLQSFCELNHAPSACYDEMQWENLHALYQVLRVVVAQLKVVFRQHGKIDYIENAEAALLALGTEQNPTDLALALDYQIKHILIDEFQDTSNSQFRLIQKLIQGWEKNDARTLFIVGDPMQSIYRFREAEVGLFIRARKEGIGQIPLKSVTLSVNFRSTSSIVNWINNHFQSVLPSFDDMTTGAVSYSKSIANPKNETDASLVTVNRFSNHQTQADSVIKIIQQSKQKNPTHSIAILVRARSHLEYIVPALKKANLTFRALDIDPLNSRPFIQDLMSLTTALLYPSNRLAWLSILRAPWCGLSLNDLLLLSGDYPYHLIIELLQNSEIITTLSADGQNRLQRIVPILLHKLAERRRYSLRAWIESAWLLLGGPACLDQLSDLEDVNTFFELIEKLDTGADILQVAELEKEVAKLYTAPNSQADHTLQIMTIHNAKGLEFDTVILPHLERQSPHDSKQLLLWMEKPRKNANTTLILAPVHATGENPDAIYNYIKQQNAIKADYETGRLLYVAVTRAKKNLYLLLTQEPSVAEESSSPFSSKSLIEKLWPTIKHEVIDNISLPEDASLEKKEATPLKRLILNWKNPISETAEIISYHEKFPGFILTALHTKKVGILIHQILEKISQCGIAWWETTTTQNQTLYIKNHLLKLGITFRDVIELTKVITQAISNTLRDTRGQWILYPHRESRSELALTTVIDQEIKSLIIDRTFVDELGTRWIIDYKTTYFSGNNLTTFLDEEQQNYASQMHRYYEAIKHIDSRPIKIGLYFPLIPAWREWAVSTEFV